MGFGLEFFLVCYTRAIPSNIPDYMRFLLYLVTLGKCFLNSRLPNWTGNGSLAHGSHSAPPRDSTYWHPRRPSVLRQFKKPQTPIYHSQSTTVLVILTQHLAKRHQTQSDVRALAVSTGSIVQAVAHRTSTQPAASPSQSRHNEGLRRQREKERAEHRRPPTPEPFRYSVIP